MFSYVANHPDKVAAGLWRSAEGYWNSTSMGQMGFDSGALLGKHGIEWGLPFVGGEIAAVKAAAFLSRGVDAVDDVLGAVAGSRRVADNNRYMGMLGRGTEPLTPAQIQQARAYVAELGLPSDKLEFFTFGSANQRSAYSDLFDTVFVGPDLMPGAGHGLAANARVSPNGLLAHEIIGHRETTLAGRAFEAGSMYDEVQASWRAARLAPGLTNAERVTLLRDAVERVHANGLTVKDIDKSAFWFGR